MHWLSASVAVAMLAVTLASDFQCNYALCEENPERPLGTDIMPPGTAELSVEGHTISIYHEDGLILLHCNGWAALDSPAMPRSTKKLRVSTEAELYHCASPAKRSFSEALADLNVTLVPEKLFLTRLLPTPQLVTNHFIGLENITELRIAIDPEASEQSQQGTGFLTSLQNLRSLSLFGVKLSTAEIQNLPQSVNCLALGGSSLTALPKTLSETLKSLAYQRKIKLRQFESPPTGVICENNETKPTNASLIEEIEVDAWNESRMTALERCDRLKSLVFVDPNIDELPERWVAACPNLVILVIDGSANLTTLPAKLLEGASNLKSLTIQRCNLESLPDRFLEGAPNLVELNLSHNRLRTLPRNAFLGPALKSLWLHRNELDSEALHALEPLRAHTKINLNNNPLVTSTTEAAKTDQR